MLQQTHIRKTIAFLLLLAFCLGSAPRAFFHDLVAGHVDAPACTDQHSTSVLHKHSFNCDCDELVVTAPFDVQAVPEAILLPVIAEQKLPSSYSSSFQSFVQYKEGRGPPAV